MGLKFDWVNVSLLGQEHYLQTSNTIKGRAYGRRRKRKADRRSKFWRWWLGVSHVSPWLQVTGILLDLFWSGRSVGGCLKHFLVVTGVSNLWAQVHVSRIIMSSTQHQIINLLHTWNYFFFPWRVKVKSFARFSSVNFASDNVIVK